MMTEPSEDRTKALELMRDYLKGTLADQLAMTRDSDSKVNLRLTICAGILGLVTFGFPVVGRVKAPTALIGGTALWLVVFGVCLWKALSSALVVLKARVNLPGVAGGVFQSAALNKDLTSVMVLEDLVQNYARAVESNSV